MKDEKVSRYLTQEEAANFLRVKPQTMAAWRCRAIGPKYHRAGGRRVVYKLADLEAYIEAN